MGINEEDRGRSMARSPVQAARAKPPAPTTTARSREAGKQLAAMVKTLSFDTVTSEDCKEVLEWLLERKEQMGNMQWDAAAWHFLPRWDIAEPDDADWAAWRCLFQNTATNKYRCVCPRMCVSVCVSATFS